MLATALVTIGLLAAWDLFWSERGHVCVHHGGDGQSFSYLVRRNTWLNRLINPGRPGRHAGIGVGRVVHLGVRNGGRPSGWLLAHEVAHLIRQEGQITRYLVGYILSPTFRASEEAACNAWADAHAASFEATARALPFG
jgi:hypothetical protein